MAVDRASLCLQARKLPKSLEHRTPLQSAYVVIDVRKFYSLSDKLVDVVANNGHIVVIGTQTLDADQ